MSITILEDKDLITQKDKKRLSEINLIEDEWVVIKQLIKILESFASETELFESSKYVTISFIYDAITEITNGIINSNEVNSEKIDLINSITVFNTDIGIENPNDNDKIDDYSKRWNILINISQDCKDLIEKVKLALYTVIKHYWKISQDEGLIAAFLDLRYKSLSFASESQIIRIKILLREIYDEAK